MDRHARGRRQVNDLLTIPRPDETPEQYARRRLAELLPPGSTIRPLVLHRSGASQVVRIETPDPRGGWPLDITDMIAAARIGFTIDTRNRYARGIRMTAAMLDEFPRILSTWVHNRQEDITWK